MLREEAARGRALVLVTHDLHLAGQHADRVVLLSEGRIVAQGTARGVLTEELLTQTFGVALRRATGAHSFFVADG